MIPATITVEVLEHADGRPIAYVDATTVTVFAYQEPDGTHVIEICTRDDIPSGRLRLLVDGQPLTICVGEALFEPMALPAGTPCHGVRDYPPGSSECSSSSRPRLSITASRHA